MNTLSYKTQITRPEDAQNDWLIVDATDQVVGRLASRIAHILRGKHKPGYTPHVDCGDHVIIINAEQVRFTGAKELQKEYITYSGYPGGQKRTNPERLRAQHPERILENAIRGMLPKNKLGRAMYRKLHVFVGADHPHAGQKPKELIVQPSPSKQAS